MSNTSFYFLPTVRQGLAAAIPSSEDDAHRAKIDVTLRATARKMGTNDYIEEPVPQTIFLHGPGDILDFHERVVARIYPEKDVGDFEPNYFPAIEFTDADFAWRFTADRAEDGTGKLSPWITLVVLTAEERGEFGVEYVDGDRRAKNLPSSIVVSNTSLPNLGDVSRWAHVHVTEEQGRSGDLTGIIRDEPEDAVCRLLCPRRLAPGVRYTAFVVPTFKLGVLAGLGFDLESDQFAGLSALDGAWSGGDDDEDLPYFVSESDRSADWPAALHGPDNTVLRIPYYYRWDFRTGLRGDFEHLVRLLEPRELTEVGTRDIDCQRPGFGVQGVDRVDSEGSVSHRLEMEGALQPVDLEYTPWGRDPADDPVDAAEPTQTDLADLVNRPRVHQFNVGFDSTVQNSTAIDNIRVGLVSSGTSVRISWHTSLPGESRVDFGLTTDYGESMAARFSDGPEAPSRQEHTLTLTNRVPGETYHFRIVLEADNDSIVESPDCTFTMPPLPSVVPPIYGHWHRARSTVIADVQEEWLDVINLDPRHRAAAGLGSEVIRREQEPLMASAWEQLGAIESANDVLRRSQFGRDTSNQLHARLNHFATEDFLRVTAPVQRRVVVADAQSGQRATVRHTLDSQSRVPAAALDPAFRRIMRPRGPVRRRQRAGRSENLLLRLANGGIEAAGRPPKPLGTLRLCDISEQLKDSLVPTASLSANPGSVGIGESTTLTWSTTNATSCTASGPGWTGPKASSGSEEVVPFPSGTADPGTVTPGSDDSVVPGTVTPGSGGTVPGPPPGPQPIPGAFYRLSCSGPEGSANASVQVSQSGRSHHGDGGVGRIITGRPIPTRLTDGELLGDLVDVGDGMFQAVDVGGAPVPVGGEELTGIKKFLPVRAGTPGSATVSLRAA